MEVREVLKRLDRDGWVVVRTRGDHRQLKHPAKAGTVTVSGHMRQYAVLYERGERNWSAYVPDLPGCVATGKTCEEAEQRMREAIAFHIEGLKIDGEPIPELTVEAGIISVAT